jgi:hypothetical protein
MDQHTNCLYLSRKGFSAKAIHTELVQLVGSDAIGYSMVTLHLRASRWTAQTEERHPDPLQTLSTKQFSEPLSKAHSRQCANWQGPLVLPLQ